MKSCPTCNRSFEDTLTYCLVDGSILSAPFDPTKRDSQATEIMPSNVPGPTEAANSPSSRPGPTMPAMFQQAAVVPPLKSDDALTPTRTGPKPNILIWFLGGIALLLVIVIALLFFRGGSQPQTASRAPANASTPASTQAATPDEGKAHRDRALAFKAEKRWAEAETEYREAIRLNPSDMNAHANLGDVLGRQKRFDEAVAEYREALRLKPDLDPIKAAAIHYNIGRALYDQNKYSEAEAEYREAIRLDPNLGMAHMNLAVALNDEKRYTEAESEMREAVRLNPNDALVHLNLALVLENEGKSSEAKSERAKADQLKNRKE